MLHVIGEGDVWLSTVIFQFRNTEASLTRLIPSRLCKFPPFLPLLPSSVRTLQLPDNSRPDLTLSNFIRDTQAAWLIIWRLFSSLRENRAILFSKALFKLRVHFNRIICLSLNSILWGTCKGVHWQLNIHLSEPLGYKNCRHLRNSPVNIFALHLAHHT